jgi:hypothetical protein
MRTKITSGKSRLSDDVSRGMNMSERTEAFKKELAALCRKYKCEITAADHWIGYAECGQDVRITVEFTGSYTLDSKALLAWEELDLGTFFDGLKD